ncbi:hypothetical protein AAEX28_12085 [Lentisphaerota bacterium WC36G]|nr:hypothetical protein LJT99_14915 [Lentisphaerae bacterium WC36]
MKNNKIFLTAIVMLLLSITFSNSYAEVYLLRELSKSNSTKSNNEGKIKAIKSYIQNDLQLQLMPSEPMVINGLNIDLGMAMTKMSLLDCFNYFKNKYKDLKIKVNNNTFIVSFLNDKGELERFYFFQDDPKKLTNAFYMTIPKNAPKEPKLWPSDLPQTNGMKATQTIKLPNRNNSMARFSFVGNKNAMINSLSSKLNSAGYIAYSDPSTISNNALKTGNLFISKDASEIVMFSVSDNGKGTIIKRKIAKE